MAVITVNGEINKESLGITLMHEHLFVDSRFEYKSFQEIVKEELGKQKVNISNLHLLKKNPYIVEDNLFLSDENLAVSELLEFKKSGGGTILEVSSIGIGRSPVAIKNVSTITGINIIMGCGHYLEETLPDWVFKKSEKELIKEIVSEIHYGVDKTNIKPGIIGEVGIGPIIEEWDKKSLRVSAKVHQETGLPISVHIQAVPSVSNFSGGLNGVEVLNILEKSGVNLNKVVICHTDAKIDIKYIKNIIDLGAYAEFDHIGKEFYYEESDFLMDRDMDRVHAIKELIESGYAKRILISQDLCYKTDLTAYGGFGYSHILNNIVPIMLKKGIKREDIDNIMIKNPMSLLDVGEKYL